MAAPKAKPTKPKVCQLAECGKEYNRLMREPGVREKPESVPHYEKRMFCSAECAQKARIVYPETANCLNPLCGKEFRFRKCASRPRKYCSRECRAIGLRDDPNMSSREKKATRVSLRKGANQHSVYGKGKGKTKRGGMIKFKSSGGPSSGHVFPEGERKEVWRPASWQK